MKILAGPTAVGKSEVAIQIARQVGIEIISADSMQIYHGMDIGTAKPSLKIRQETPHHLIDILDPWEAYSVGCYVKDAQNIIRNLESRGKEHLVVGGTALYLKALTEGLFQGPGADWEVRHELEAVAAEKGIHYLHSKLEEVDPNAAQRIERGDLRRVVRALEVYQKTGRPISYWQQEWERGTSPPEADAPTYRMVILSMDRRALYRRIEERVERMFEDGLVEEVRRLLAHHMGLSRQAREALGYAEVIEYLEGKRSLSDTKELIKRNTRRFAKRQMTWFRSFVRRGRAGLIEMREGIEEVAKRVTEVLYPRQGKSAQAMT